MTKTRGAIIEPTDTLGTDAPSIRPKELAVKICTKRIQIKVKYFVASGYDKKKVT